MKTNCPAGGLADLSEIRPDLKPDPNKTDILKAQIPVYHKGRLLGFAESCEFIDASKTEVHKSAELADNSVFDSLFDFDEEPEEISKSADNELTPTDRVLMSIWPAWLRS